MRGTLRPAWSWSLGVLLPALAGMCAPSYAAPPQYRLTQQVPLPGDEGWDYLAFEPGGQRLFIAHGTRVLVVDTDKLVVVGEIANTPGAHGIALAPELNRGFISAGKAGVIVVFDLKTLARLKEIKTTGDNPDAILYDPATERVFAFNGGGRNVTAVDARTETVIGTLPLDAKPEFAVSDGHGRVYVNLQDRNSIALIDPRALKVAALWPLASCESPSGLALDAAGERLFPVCANKVMAVVHARTGQGLGTAPIGSGADAAAYDAGMRLVFAACGEGVLTAVAVAISPGGAPAVVQSVATRQGARTMALDERHHRIFLVTSDFGAPAPATPEQPRPRPAIVPGSFRLLVVEPRPEAPGSAARGGTQP
jgi:DNA-binding beta-propeller fold protein YncE